MRCSIVDVSELAREQGPGFKFRLDPEIFSLSTNFTSLLPVVTTLAFTGLNGN